MMADVITKNNNGRYKEEKKRNRRVSDPRVSTINGNQINGHVLVWLKQYITKEGCIKTCILLILLKKGYWAYKLSSEEVLEPLV